MKSETKYIFSKGDLTRQDFSIKYKNEKGNFYLPIEKVKEIKEAFEELMAYDYDTALKRK